MKKLIILLSCIFLFSSNVNSKTYYSDYVPYLYNVEKKLKEDDTLKREELILYNTYQEIKVPTNFESNINKCKYYYKDIYYDEIVSDSKEKIGEYDLLYQSVPQRNKMLYSIELIFKDEYKIYDVYITNKGKKIDYTVTKNTISNVENIMDDDLLSYASTKYANHLILEFESTLVNNMEFHFIADEGIVADLFLDYDDGTGFLYGFSANHFDFITFERKKELKNAYGVIGTTQITNPHYKNVIRNFLCYDVEKKKTNIYQEKNEKSILDDTKTLYNYFKREKIVIDDINITEENFNLKDLITYSTIDLNKIEVSSDINYKKNGTYKVNFIVDDNFKIEHDVNLKIEEEQQQDPIVETEVVYLTETEECSHEIVEKYIYKDKEQKVDYRLIVIFTLLILIIVILVIRILRKK